MFKPLGFTSNETTRLTGTTIVATCDAVRKNGFAAAAAQARTRSEVWSIDGYDPAQVIAVKVTGRAWQVLVIEPEPKGLIDRMAEAHLFNAGEQ